MGDQADRREQEGRPAVGRAQLDLNLPPGDLRTSHVVPRKLSIRSIPCNSAWDSLSSREKNFSHHFARASWAGSRICARQLSPESPDILKILLLMFYEASPSDTKETFLAAGIAEESWESCMSYASCFLANLGNYLAFGDIKIIPGISEDDFERILVLCTSFLTEEDRQTRLLELWEATKHRMFSLEPGERHLGLHPKGISMYYIGNITEEEVYMVQEWMTSHGIEAWNTRLGKRASAGDGELPEYDVLIASSLEQPSERYTHEDKCVIHLLYGDHMEELLEVVLHLKQALRYTTSEPQRAAVENYIGHFETGSLDPHKESQKHWLKIGDEEAVNANIGFIETYRDPLGLRAEFEGYVAIADQEQSAKFAALADATKKLFPLLPWPREFERDFESPPGFSSLDILVFANGNIPAGINIPNYEDIRQSFGFRNIAFANVLHTEDLDEQVPFLKDSDKALLKVRKAAAMEIQLGCHELLGHGSGKLFVRNTDGTYNFDQGNVIHPFTEEIVVSCYDVGEKWDSVFGQISASYEECRAECVGVFFSTKEEVLEIFGHRGQDAQDIIYATWLIMIRAGLLALEYYSPDSGDWRQPHMQARFGILRILLAASGEATLQRERDTGTKGTPFLQLQRLGRDSALILLDREQIKTVGVPAVAQLMTRLQVYKSTADMASGRDLYHHITTVPDYLLPFRSIVLAQKRPRPFLLQPNTFDTATGITLQEYQVNCEGFVQSFVDRFRSWIPIC